MKKTFAFSIAMLMLLVLLLGGCATATTAPTAAPTVAPTAVAAATATVAPAPTPAPVSGTLSFLNWYTQAQFQPVLDAFQKLYPNVTIDFQNIPNANNQYAQRLQLLANSGQLPDLFYIQPPVTLFAQSGYLADISGLDAVQKLPQKYKDGNAYQGKVYAFSEDAWVGGIFYNKDLFTKYNIQPNFSNWSDFLAACKVFQQNNIRPISMAAGEIDDLLFMLHIVNELPKDPTIDVDLNTGKSKFSDGYLADLTTWTNDCVKTGIITQDMVGESDQQRMDEFSTGKAAMTISGPWAIPTFTQKNPGIKLGIIPLSGINGNQSTIGALNVGIALSATAKNPDAAKAMLNFLATAEGAQLYQKVTGNFLAISGVDYTVDPVMEPMKQFASSGSFDFPPVYWTYSSDIGDMLGKGCENIVLGTTTPDKVCSDIDAKVADLISSNSN